MHYVEIGGGLGDIINQCYLTGNYVALDGITQRTTILLACPHKFAKEIFTQHPKHDLFDIIEGRYVGYPVFPDGVDLEETRQRLAGEGYTKLPVEAALPEGDVVFYPSESDQALLRALPPRFIAFQPFSGTSDRDLPAHIVKAIDDCAAQAGVPLVVIGRNYDRPGKVTREEFTSAHAVVNYIDKLSAPGSIELVKRSSLFIGGHSSMNLAAWHNRVPNYILFPELHGRQYFNPDQFNEWNFGRDYPETRVDFFADFSLGKIEQLLKLAAPTSRTGTR
jgi:hypothetical protein